MNNNPDILTNIFGYDKGEVEYEMVTNNLRGYDIEYGIEVIFDYWRKKGFPHYQVREDEKHSMMRKLRKFDVNTILDEDKIVQTMHGLRMAWTYFPHWVDIRCGNAPRTPMETFMDDEKLKSVIRKCWRWCSTQFAGEEGIDLTFEGLEKIKKDFFYLKKSVELHKLGSEEFIPDRNSLDLCFTSPPYFDTEKYSDEDTQSYIKFPTKEEWVNGFLRKTIENCYRGLKDGKYMLINIANTPKYKFIEEETQKIAKELGFVQNDTLQLTLSSVMGAGYKYEPIFVFKKN